MAPTVQRRVRQGHTQAASHSVLKNKKQKMKAVLGHEKTEAEVCREVQGEFFLDLLMSSRHA